MITQYSINDLAQLSRIKAHTLRIWEQRYGLLKPERTKTNIRLYTQDDLKHLLNVSVLYDHGVKISNIAKLDNEEIREKVRHLKTADVAFHLHVQSLIIAMLDIDEIHFEDLLSRNLKSLGMETTMEHVLFPFLQQIGILWQTNTITPVQEHFISNLIRQKIIGAVDRLEERTPSSSKRFVLFLPQDEMHEISLLYSHYLLKNRGHRSLYLGQSVPLQDLSGVLKTRKVDVLITVITSQPCGDDVQPYLDKVAELNPGTEIWISGYQVRYQTLRIPANVHIMENLDDFKSRI